MQRKKNIRLLAAIVVLSTAAVILGLTTPAKSRLDIDRDKFTYNPQLVDRVVLTRQNGERNILAFTNGQWMLNDTLKADPQRITVLFAILSQAQVRRKAPASELEELSSLFNEDGVLVEIFEGNNSVKSFEVGGNEVRQITYYRENPEDDIFLVEIPGYRNYLASIYQLDENGWRYPRIFDFNWQNLKRVDVNYTARLEDFGISARNGFYSVEELPKTDTARLTEFLDNLSLLYVNDFLSDSEIRTSGYDSLTSDLKASVVVTDVGDNAYRMEVLGTLPGGSEILIRIDSSDYALASFDLMNSVLKPRQFFLEKEQSE